MNIYENIWSFILVLDGFIVFYSQHVFRGFPKMGLLQ